MSLKKSDKSKDKKQHEDPSQESGNGSNAENRSLVSIIDAQKVSTSLPNYLFINEETILFYISEMLRN